MIQILPHKVEDLLALKGILSLEEGFINKSLSEYSMKNLNYELGVNNAALDLWNAAIRSNPALKQDYILYKELIDSLKPKDEIDLSCFPKNYGMSVTKPLLNDFRNLRSFK